MLLQDLDAVGIVLHLADACHTRPFEAEVEAADSGEEGQKLHSFAFISSISRLLRWEKKK